MPTLWTNIPEIIFGAAETKTVSVDWSGRLSTYPAGTAPTDPQVTVTPIGGGEAVTLPDEPVCADMAVTQRVTAGLLEAGTNYLAKMTVTPSGTTDVLEVLFKIKVDRLS